MLHCQIIYCRLALHPTNIMSESAIHSAVPCTFYSLFKIILILFISEYSLIICFNFLGNLYILKLRHENKLTIEKIYLLLVSNILEKNDIQLISAKFSCHLLYLTCVEPHSEMLAFIKKEECQSL